MKIRIFASLCITTSLIAASDGASAGIWDWRCQGQLGEQQVIFNRESMAVIDSKKPLGDIKKSEETIGALLKDAGVTYDPQNGNNGLSGTLEFIRHGDPKHKIVLDEQSSKKVFRKSRLICGRDETTDIFRKVYRYQRDDEPARDITMQCLEYQLSTRGGRKGC
jgi:hypothetical protein